MNTLTNTSALNTCKISRTSSVPDKILANLNEQATHTLNTYYQYIQALCNKHGIHIPPAVELTMTLEGYITVGKGRTDQALLEEVLNSSQVIVESFKEVEVLYRMLHKLTSFEQTAEAFHIGITSLGAIAFFTAILVTGK